MSISMHSASAPIFVRLLTAMLGWLDKAQAHAEAEREKREVRERTATASSALDSTAEPVAVDRTPGGTGASVVNDGVVIDLTGDGSAVHHTAGPIASDTARSFSMRSTWCSLIASTRPGTSANG